MKKILVVFLSLLFVLVNGCDNEGGTGTDPFGGGGGTGTGNVTITVDIGTFEGNNWFGFSPNVQIKLNSAVATQAQLGINETVNNPNPNQIFNANEMIAFYQVPQQAQVGQQWSFRFQGTLAQGGQAFDVTVNYTIQ